MSQAAMPSSDSSGNAMPSAAADHRLLRRLDRQDEELHPADIPADKLTTSTTRLDSSTSMAEPCSRMPRQTSDTPMSRPTPILATSGATSISSDC